MEKNNWWQDAPIVSGENNNIEFNERNNWWQDAPIVDDENNNIEKSLTPSKIIEKSLTPPKITGQLTRGILGGVGDTANLLPLASGAIDKGIAYALPEGNLKKEFNKKGDEFLSYNIGDKVRNWFDDITNNKYKPKSTTDNIIDTTGSFLSPAGISGKLIKNTGKIIPAAISGATVLETTREKHFLPENLPAREIVEDVIKTTIGSSAPSIANNGLKLFKKATTNILTKGDVSKKVLNYAKKEGVELPYHVATKNKTSMFLANNMFKSYFISKSWDNIVENADKSMIDKVIKNVNNVSKNIKNKEEVSLLFRENIKDVFKDLKDKANTLYEPAILAGKKEIVKNSDASLNPLIDSINTIKNKFNPSKYSLDSGGKFVYNKALNVQKKLLSNKKISVETLINQRSSLLKDLNYGKAEGNKNWLNSLVIGIDDSLNKIAENSKNKDFNKLYKSAQNFYKNQYVARVKSNMSKALINGEMPKEAYSYMNSVSSIKQLEKIIGDNKKMLPIMQDLKRAKLQEILIDKVFDNGGTLSHSNLSNLFNKKSTEQGLLKELLGANNYKSMQRLSVLSARFINSGKKFANPSGTSHSSKDKLIAHSLTGLFSFGIGGKTAGLSLITPWGLSKMMSNKKITDKLVDISVNGNKNKLTKTDMFMLENLIVGANKHEK